MEQTARFVREAGGQSEFKLVVQQAANPAFAFLKPRDRLHPYFRWLVKEGALVRLRYPRQGCMWSQACQVVLLPCQETGRVALGLTGCISRDSCSPLSLRLSYTLRLA